MLIRARVNYIKDHMNFIFCNITWKLFNTDYINIYDKHNGSCLYSFLISEIDSIPSRVLDLEYNFEELKRLDVTNMQAKSPVVVCLYLHNDFVVPDSINLGIKYK